MAKAKGARPRKTKKKGILNQHGQPTGLGFEKNTRTLKTVKGSMNTSKTTTRRKKTKSSGFKSTQGGWKPSDVLNSGRRTKKK